MTAHGYRDSNVSKPKYSDGYETPELSDRPEFKTAQRQVEAWLKGKRPVFLVEIVRAFPQHERIILSIITLSKHIEVIDGFREKYVYSEKAAKVESFDFVIPARIPNTFISLG